jgi:hypothetical protein
MCHPVLHVVLCFLSRDRNLCTGLVQEGLHQQAECCIGAIAGVGPGDKHAGSLLQGTCD